MRGSEALGRTEARLERRAHEARESAALDPVVREAERENAAHEAACRERCPLACALQAELAEMLGAVDWLGGSFSAGSPWALLADADTECQRAKEKGVDLTMDAARRIAAVCQAERERA